MLDVSRSLGCSDTFYGLIKRLFLMMALVGTTILVISGGAIHYFSKQYMVEKVESEAISISDSLTDLYSYMLMSFDADKQQKLDISSGYDVLDDRLRGFLSPFHVLDIKVFSPDSTIQYAKEFSLLGRAEQENRLLQQALEGSVASRMLTNTEVRDMDFKTRMDVDLVKSYLPIENRQGDIIGAFELALDTTRYREDLVKVVLYGTAFQLLVFAVLFVIVLRFARKPALQLEHAKNQLQRYADQDCLTNVCSRRKIVAELEAEFRRSVRSDRPLAIAIIDIDHFKRINDRHGHQVGDEVLHRVAQEIRCTLRDTDVVGRYGGEEFLVLLPDTERRGALHLLERVRQAVSVLNIQSGNHKIFVTISAGVAQRDKSDVNECRMMSLADDALYYAKAQGRNQVMTDVVQAVSCQTVVPFSKKTD